MLYLKFTLIQRGTGATVLAAGVMEIGWVMIIGCAVSNFTLSFHIFSSIYHFIHSNMLYFIIKFLEMSKLDTTDDRYL